jgi:hypothetical protein
MDDFDRFMSQFEETPEERFERFRKRQRERKAAEEPRIRLHGDEPKSCRRFGKCDGSCLDMGPCNP